MPPHAHPWWVRVIRGWHGSLTHIPGSTGRNIGPDRETRSKPARNSFAMMEHPWHENRLRGRVRESERDSIQQYIIRLSSLRNSFLFEAPSLFLPFRLFFSLFHRSPSGGVLTITEESLPRTLTHREYDLPSNLSFLSFPFRLSLDSIIVVDFLVQ